MYECEAENQFKVSKAFINIDGKTKKNWLIQNKQKRICFFVETILFNTTTTTTLSEKYHRTSSPSYGRFHYIWQMERKLAL